MGPERMRSDFRLCNFAVMGDSESKDCDGMGLGVSAGKRHKELSEEVRRLEGEVDLLKCEANSRKVWLRHRLEMDREMVVRIGTMEENAKKDLKAMIGRLEAADAEAKLLAERLEEKASKGEKDIP